MSTSEAAPAPSLTPSGGGLAFDSPNGSSPLRRHIAVFLRRRRLIGSCVAGAALIASLYNYGARPIYEAESVLALDVAGSSPLQLHTAVDQSVRAAALWEQIAALKSQDFALLVVSSRDAGLEGELSRGSMGGWSERLQREARYRLGMEGPRSTSIADQVEALRSRLAVVNEPKPGWVHVAFRAYDPVVATAASNKVIEIYVAEATRQTANSAENRRSRLQQEVKASTGKVSDSLNARKQDENWTALQDAEMKRQLLERQASGLRDALVRARQATLERRGQSDDARSLTGRELLTIPALRSDSEIQAATARIADLEAQLAHNLGTLGPRHPDVVGLRTEIASSERGLQARLLTLEQAIERDYRLAQRDEASLATHLHEVERQLSQLGAKSVEFALAQKRSDATQQAVGELIDRSVREPDQGLYLSPRVVQLAEGPAPLISPQRSRNLLYGLAIGFGLGLALAWLLRSLDESITTPEQIPAFFSLPCLGLVPQMNATDISPLLDTGPSISQMTEAYRLIRTNIMASHPENHSVWLLVTSTSEGEGKTTTSLGLGVALAASGSRVLLIDGDVRRFTLSRLTGLEGRHGLSDLATGAPPQSCVFSTHLPGLASMPAGSQRDRAIEAISGAGFPAMIRAATRGYDWVVCDAPPILAVADAAILCRVADEVVMVVRAGQVPVAAVQAAVTQVTAVGGKLRGIILNAADFRADSHYYRYYYRGYDAGGGASPGKPKDSRLTEVRRGPETGFAEAQPGLKPIHSRTTDR